jgi:hypothetical protein
LDLRKLILCGERWEEKDLKRGTKDNEKRIDEKGREFLYCFFFLSLNFNKTFFPFTAHSCTPRGW